MWGLLPETASEGDDIQGATAISVSEAGSESPKASADAQGAGTRAGVIEMEEEEFDWAGEGGSFIDKFVTGHLPGLATNLSEDGHLRSHIFQPPLRRHHTYFRPPHFCGSIL